MKSAFLFLITVTSFASSMAFAKPTCSYVLNSEIYWEDASGVLTLDSKKYNCKTLIIGRDSDMLTVCKDPTKTSTPEIFDYIVGFDGAEADFSVSTGIWQNSSICSGVATEK
jgi:hypothetical protein